MALVVDLVGSLPDSRDRSLGNQEDLSQGPTRDFTIWATITTLLTDLVKLVSDQFKTEPTILMLYGPPAEQVREIEGFEILPKIKNKGF